jgi:hypothetical protein
MKVRGTLLTCVLGIAIAACADPRRTAVPPPGGEPSGYNGTSGVSTMRYQEESEAAQRVARQEAGREAERQARLHEAPGAKRTTTATARR